MKTLSQQITEAQEASVALKDALIVATKALEETPDDATEGAVVEATAAVEKSTAKLEALKRAETALAGKLEVEAPSVIQLRGKSSDTDNLYGALAAITFESKIKGVPMEAVVASRFPGNKALDTMVKAVHNPAMSDVPGYAQELTRIGYGQLLDLLRSAAILPKCVPAMAHHTFDGYASISVPVRTGTDTQASGNFRAEGSPIPVKGLTFTSLTLTPKNMAVILTATAEMLRRSSIDLASYFQQAIVKDTADSLDYTFVSATAGSAIQPAGIRNGVAGGDTRASSGNTTANIVTDLKVMLSALATANMGGPSSKWLMHPARWYAVSMAITATGALQFPETANGMLVGIPVVVSTKMPADVVLLVDFEHITSAFGNPAFEASNVATIHEDDVPDPISTVGVPGVVAAPVRSLFQTNSWAIRMLLDADWMKTRSSGLVQQLTAVAW